MTAHDSLPRRAELPDYHAMTAEDVAQQVRSGAAGLAAAEAATRRGSVGANELAQAPPPSRIWLLLNHSKRGFTTSSINE